MPLKWDETEKMVKRIEDAGCPVLVWTVDLLAGRNTPTMTRFARQDTRNCVSCHKNGAGTPVPGFRPMYEGLGLEGRYNPPDATWATFDRLKKLTRMKVMLKGIDSAEDAQLAVQHGVDGLVVSNHGGRATETLRATIDCLPEVVEAVRGRVPVFLDGGVRHGADIYKALASGARGVGIGRPGHLGLVRIRSGRHRAGARNPARRAHDDDEADGNADGKRHHPGPGRPLPKRRSHFLVAGNRLQPRAFRRVWQDCPLQESENGTSWFVLEKHRLRPSSAALMSRRRPR